MLLRYTRPSWVTSGRRAKEFIWEKVGSPPRVMLRSKWVTLHPGSPCLPSKLRAFSCERFAAIYKEMPEKLWKWLGLEGNPPSRDNSSPYKQALNYCAANSYPLLYISHLLYTISYQHMHLFLGIQETIYLLLVGILLCAFRTSPSALLPPPRGGGVEWHSGTFWVGMCSPGLKLWF